MKFFGKSIQIQNFIRRAADVNRPINLMKAEKTWYLTKDQELTDDAEKAAFVLINEGQDIPPHMQKKYFAKKKAEEPKKASPAKNKKKSPAKNKSKK